MSKLPKMIVFDYGDTLLYEPGFDTLRGNRALHPYITKNPDNLTAEDINAFFQKMYTDEFSKARAHGFEIHERQMQRMTYEYLGIELSISYEEAELVFWRNTSQGAMMPHTDEMLDALNAKGIRSGVISNIGFSENALRERINRLLPRNRFEFIIATSEYGIRKPHPYLFEIALRKAGLSPKEVWFCGDNIDADVEGAAAVGIYPVWYEDLVCENPFRTQSEGKTPSCEHLHLHDWREMMQVLEGLTP